LKIANKFVEIANKKIQEEKRYETLLFFSMKTDSSLPTAQTSGD
jgi:hypothetical protein